MNKSVFKKILFAIGLVIAIVLIIVSSKFLYEIAIKYEILVDNTQDTAPAIDEEETPDISTEDDIETVLARLYPIDSNSKYIKDVSSIYNGIEAHIKADEVSILVRSEASEKFSGLISNSYFEGDTIIRANVSSKKKIKTLLVGYYQDSLELEFMKDIPYIFFLMEDGSVEYIDIKILLKNGQLTNPPATVRTRGEISELSNIVKLEQCRLANEEEGYSTAVAIDKDGKVYNLFEFITWNDTNY